MLQQGDTADEALSDIKEAIQLCLEDMRELNQQIPIQLKRLLVALS